MVSKASVEKQSQEETETVHPEKTDAAETVQKAAKKAPARRSRAKSAKEVRLKAYWGVFNQSLNAVVLFEYGERREAQKRAEELSESRKSPHFVQLVKRVIEE